MLRRVRHFSWEQVQRHSAAAGSVAIGAVTLDSVPADACRFTPDGRSALFLDGEIHDAEREGRRLQQTGARLLTHGAAEVVFRGWRAEGTTFLARLNGTFSAAIWDDDRGELHLITDRFGLRPLYVALAAGGCVASSEIKAVLGCGGVPRGRSEDGIAAFFAFGYLFGTETFFAGIRALPPSTCATFRPADADYREARYWAPRPPGPGRRERAGDLADALDTSLATAVERRAPAGERLGLSLSGGLDARTLLALVPSGRDLQSISLGIEGSIDHRSAARLAELAGVRHRNYVLGEGFLGEFERHLRSMILLTDGHYLDQGIVMPTLPVYRELGIEKLLRGHGGELLHMRKAYAFSLDAEAPRLSEEALERWLFDHLTGYMLGGVPADLFEIDVAGRARAALHTAYLQAAEQADAPIDRVWRLFLAERLHRETALSMHQFNCFAMVRLPYLDPDVVDALLAMPASMKMGDALADAHPSPPPAGLSSRRELEHGRAGRRGPAARLAVAAPASGLRQARRPRLPAVRAARLVAQTRTARHHRVGALERSIPLARPLPRRRGPPRARAARFRRGQPHVPDHVAVHLRAGAADARGPGSVCRHDRRARRRRAGARRAHPRCVIVAAA